MDDSRLPRLGPRGEGWVALQIVLLAAVAASAFARPRWPPTGARARRSAGVALCVAAGAELLVATRALGESLTPLPKPRARGRLQRTSIYGFVRHPMYGGLVVGSLGWALVFSPVALVPAGLLAATLELKARVEERWLLASHPGYEAYRRAVPGRLFPSVRPGRRARSSR